MESRFFNASLETEIRQKRLKGSKNRDTKSLKAFINCCREKNITRRRWIKKYRISKNPRELLGKITWREKEINDEQKKISRYGTFPFFLINICLWPESIYSWSKRREMKTVSELQAHLKWWFCSVICQLKPDSHMPPTYLDTVTAYVNIYRRIIIDPRLAYVFAGAPWPALLDDLAAMKIILYVNIHSGRTVWRKTRFLPHNSLLYRYNGWELRQFDLHFAQIWVRRRSLADAPAA